MLLPSALTCDPSHSSHPSQSRSLAPHPRLQPGLFASPPASPPFASSQAAFGSIATTCRSLQSLIASPIVTSTSYSATASASPPPSLTQLPTPPLAHAPPPLKLRLRSRRPSKIDNAVAGDDALTTRKRVVKRTAPPRGANKRRRGESDDMGRDDAQDSDDAESDAEAAGTPSLSTSLSSSPLPQSPVAPSTPKRARIAPEHLPLGLERSDFHNVHILENSKPSNLNSQHHHNHNDQQQADEQDSTEWSAEDDRILVELVLDKLKLTKTEWQNCARGLGKDRHSVSRRWKSLIMNGDVGLKTRGGGRRAKLHATWR